MLPLIVVTVQDGVVTINSLAFFFF